MRNQAIDALRALMILSVMAFHYLVFWRPPFSNPDLLHLDQVYPSSLALGALGVRTFFIISGVVISMTLERCGGAADFSYRRFSRLAPSFIVCCTLTFLLSITVKDEGSIPSFGDYLATFTLHPELFHRSFVDGAYWSLAVEVRFYAYVAIAFWLLGREWWLLIAGLGVLAIAQSFIPFRFTDKWLLGANIHFFLFGMALWFISGDRRRKVALTCFGIATAAFLLKASTDTVRPDLLWLTNATIIGVSIAVAVAVMTPVGHRWPLGPLPRIGRYSYSLYLIHQQFGVWLIGWLKRFAGVSDLVAVASASLAAIALAAAIFHLVEEPGQRWLRRLWHWREARTSP